MRQLIYKIFSLALLGFVAVEALGSQSDVDETKLTIRELIAKHGYRGETHRVTTEDGYILGMHRITGPKGYSNPKGKQPVLLMHPLLSSSADFVVTGPGRALGYVLADAGYDVWLGNVRGNVFSSKHKKYTTNDKEFWLFSWHESGVYDLPAMIDYVLKETNREQLLYVGHSEGTTEFWVMASERPEYQDKVKAMIALAPVAYLTHMRSPLYHVLASNIDHLDNLSKLLGDYEFKPADALLKKAETIACAPESLIQPLCTHTMFLIAGPGSGQLNTTMLPIILKHVPAGGSVRQVLHYLQVLKAQRFQQYDHGLLGNLWTYKRRHPPTYNLGKIKVPTYLHYSSNDWLSVPKDIDRLYRELGNPIGKFLVPLDEFTHLDFIWANDSKKLLYNKVIDQLNEYKN